MNRLNRPSKNKQKNNISYPMKTILVGLDAFDPKIFEALHDQGKMPNLGKFVDKKGYSRFTISNPAQSEVSWTSIATGQNPGGHGMFDFVHRSPKNYGIHVSLLPTKKTMVGTTFTQPHEQETIFDYAVEHGYPAASLWWPATFPARLTSPIKSIPGLGTPDILGKLGVGILFNAEDLGDDAPSKTQVEKLVVNGDRCTGVIKGPGRPKGDQIQESTIEFSLNFTGENTATLELDKKSSIELTLGEWSPVLELTFKIGFGVKLQAVTRVILTHGKASPRLYFLPLQIHPLKAAWPYAAPRDFIKRVWKQDGPFLTLGWPQDTTGLDEGITTDEQFLALADSIVATREQVFYSQLEQFQEGLLGIVFDTLDRVQHMFYNNDRNVIENWYLKLDGLVGRIENKIKATGNQEARLLIVSDHGFANFDHKVHLNKWLIEQGLLAAPAGEENSLAVVDWSKSQAYAVGLNSLYFNQTGREGYGIVSPDEREALEDKIKSALLSWKGPDGSSVVQSVETNQEAFEGPYSHLGPDMMVGYAPGYRASAETGLGNWAETTIEANHDHWNADHCINPAAVQGVLFSSDGLEDFPNPSYKDIPSLAVGTKLKGRAKPPKEEKLSDEDRETVEERLKGLGYL
jgi:predicted AlkP superfamily phosphohydrolase/phosphomutase